MPADPEVNSKIDHERPADNEYLAVQVSGFLQALIRTDLAFLTADTTM